MTCINNDIPDNIMAYIGEIAERMRQGRATVMIGSGFSKNAIPIRHTEKKFLDWSQLGDIFYKKLYGKYPKNEEKPYFYNDVMKLAGRVEECFGRTVLDKLIIDNLPDEEYEPSELHEMLLKLNWSDIFTTNYDTLLERTRKKVFNKRYELIVSKDDLVFSKEPRIIKLHGSFPSIRPFIVTEEDYRKYPKDFAIFVNTVQQSLIENTMCMIGFSGEDPNFLNWIGWLRDNLGVNVASKIYLIGVFKEQLVEREFFHSKNVVLVNMKECMGVGERNYANGLKLFFEKLLELQSEKENKIWSEFKSLEVRKVINSLRSFALINKEDKKEVNEKFWENLKKVTAEWKRERELYPGWLIVPYDRREHLLKSVQSMEQIICSFSEWLDNSDYIEQIGEFLYEFEWRRHSSLLSQKANWIQVYVKYLNSVKKENLGDKDIYIGLSLLEYYRLIGDFDRWNEYSNKMEQVTKGTSFEQKFYLEKIYQKLYTLDYLALDRLLVKSPQYDSSSNDVFLYSAILVEMGHYTEAIEYLMKNLNEMRREIGDNVDYQKFSYEANYITILDYLEKYIDYHESYPKSSANTMQDYAHYRLLRGYECDLKYENDYLINSMVKMEENYLDTDVLNKNVDVEQYMNFMENTGMTFRSNYLVQNVDKIPLLIRAMMEKNPYRAFISTIRFSDVTITKELWNYMNCKSFTKDSAEAIAKVCIESCMHNKEYILENKAQKFSTVFIELPDLITIILSGVVCKLSSDSKYKVFRFIKFALENLELGFGNLALLLHNTMYSLNSQELHELWDEIMTFPANNIEKNTNSLGKMIEPSLYINVVKILNEKKNFRFDFNMDLKTNQSEINTSFYRKILCEILNNSFQMDISQYQIEKIEDSSAKRLVSMYLCGLKGTEQINSVKNSYITRLEQEIELLKDYENLKCIELYSGLRDLLDELEYYQTKGIKWYKSEIKKCITAFAKWIEHVKRLIENLAYSQFCRRNGRMLEEILLIMLINGENESAIDSGILEEIIELKYKLQQIQISFVVDSLYKANFQINEDLENLILLQAIKGKDERNEIEMILKVLSKYVEGDQTKRLNTILLNGEVDRVIS